ncbi:hypothetical protein MLD38_004380 [Melastoma candidum]|uniref:Uncharacterized protein n=1 Tax=Melastoma candidum TaxID=119954 RepID=A0ACB9S9E0_9MYRT|nr:hypothetical protein MLD38_004380 [Melastoma candidum]
MAARRSPAALSLSWHSKPDDSQFNGWGSGVTEQTRRKGREGLGIYLIGAIGASIVVLVAAIARFSHQRGFKIRFPVFSITMVKLTSSVEETETSLTDGQDASMPEESVEMVVQEAGGNMISDVSRLRDKTKRIIIPPLVDSTQQEALMILKRLKIIEDGIKPDELCTKREYARWLVRMNSSLERNPRRRIVPSSSLLGSGMAAFDDVNVEDRDFEAIQALAESGVISSKLSLGCSIGAISDNHPVLFFPDRNISREDLINWRVQLEYDYIPKIEEMSKTKVGFMDMKEFSSALPPEFFRDLLAGDKSIVRKAFGQSKRFQPSKPVTNAQAAVALVSGQMMDAIQIELSRQEAEEYSRKVTMDEIKNGLLERGDIKKYWDEKLKGEETRGSEVEKDYLSAIDALQQEKLIHEKKLQEHMKEKAALDCQKQLILSLEEEVDEMSERLGSERSSFVAEQCWVQDMISELQTKQEGMLDTKSVLEAEKEALRILRSWVEEEARKSQARAKVLEKVGRRWKWDDNQS